MTPAERNENRRLFDAYEQRLAAHDRRLAEIKAERTPHALAALGGDAAAATAIAALDAERSNLAADSATLRDGLEVLRGAWEADLPLQAVEARAARFAEARIEAEALLEESAEADQHFELGIAALHRRAAIAVRLANFADIDLPPVQPIANILDTALAAAGMTRLASRFQPRADEPNTLSERDAEALRLVLDESHPAVAAYNRIVNRRNAEMLRQDARSRETWNDQVRGRAMPVATVSDQLATISAARRPDDPVGAVPLSDRASC